MGVRGFLDSPLERGSSSFPRLLFTQVANNAVFYYNSDGGWRGRLRVLDAFEGNLLWDSLHDYDFRDSTSDKQLFDMAVAGGSLYALSAHQVDVYRPANTIYLAQLADGWNVSTLVTLANLRPDPAQGTLEFFDDAGNPIAVALEGSSTMVTSVEFELEPNETTVFQTSRRSVPPVVGWARATATQPIRGSAVFQAYDGNTIVFEAGVGDTPATGRANVFVSRVSSSSSFSTGVAIANPSDSPTRVRFEFRRRLPEQGVFRTGLSLEPGEHAARFIEELFGEDAPPRSEGTLIIESEIPVVVTALRTKNGYPMSSYPVGIPGK